MPLILPLFKERLADILGANEPDCSPEAREKIVDFADDLAIEIDAYIKSATVNVPINTIVATTGTAVAQVGTGVGVGIGLLA